MQSLKLGPWKYHLIPGKVPVAHEPINRKSRRVPSRLLDLYLIDASPPNFRSKKKPSSAIKYYYWDNKFRFHWRQPLRLVNGPRHERAWPRWLAASRDATGLSSGSRTRRLEPKVNKILTGPPNGLFQSIWLIAQFLQERPKNASWALISNFTTQVGLKLKIQGSLELSFHWPVMSLSF